MAKKNASNSVFRTPRHEQVKQTTIVSESLKVSAKKKITLSITQEDSDVVKMYALRNHTTVSDLLHEWILNNCQD